MAVRCLSDGPSIEVLGRFFMFSLVYNEGGAMGTNFGSSVYYLVSSLLVLSFVLYYLYLNRHSRIIAWPLAFISGGAVGNILDRVRLGRVVDFLDVDFFDVDIFGLRLERWWTFNVADAAITCAIIVLVVSLLFTPKAPKSPPSAEQA